jgi:hypothetical protein
MSTLPYCTAVALDNGDRRSFFLKPTGQQTKAWIHKRGTKPEDGYVDPARWSAYSENSDSDPLSYNNGSFRYVGQLSRLYRLDTDVQTLHNDLKNLAQSYFITQLRDV